ncbi:MAG TPA: AAA-like domain-containing protein [Chthonomonadaceae bacterium]|nr:AAA-like domain-containing protein [Chthonomonadaceae bacterium]
MMATTDGFYVTGGSLRRDATSYVTRKADEELFQALTRTEYCYILTSRQMGKSSLMIRTAVRLLEARTRVVVLDLTAIGQNLTPEQWYDGLLQDMAQQLDLEDEMDALWERSERFGPLQRFLSALREVVLSDDQPSPVVLFVDEIDTVRSLPFSTDEFFAAIRECYNRRAKDPRFERLTFCLLGVAAPTDLIRDTRMTPFNIGRRIELTDFTLGEAAPLAEGLASRKGAKTQRENTGSVGALLAAPWGEGVLQRILYWTGGHPYLTQRLCQAVAEDAEVQGEESIANPDVDQLCEELFLSPQARERDDNLIFVRERLLRSEEDRASLLDLYGRVRAGQRVKNDETNPLVALLRLSGIVRAQEGKLCVRNRIYEQVFDRAWIRENMPDAEVRRQKQAFRRGVVRTLAVASLVLALLVGGFLLSHYQTHLKIRRELPDGSTITLEDLTYGKTHHYEAGPFRLQGLLNGANRVTLSMENDSLMAWLSHRDKHTQTNNDIIWKVTAVDEHGCVFESQQRAMGSDLAAVGFGFTAFPRRGKSIALHISDESGEPLAELNAPNPMPTLYPLWTPEPFPVTKQVGDLAITLTEVRSEADTFSDAPNHVNLLRTFRFTQNGKPTEEWEESGWNSPTVEDATGNISYFPCTLCPYEPVWKYNGSFFRKKTASFTPAETWTVKDVPVPGAGQINTIAQKATRNGVSLDVKSIAGAGIYSYVNKGNGTLLGKWNPGTNGADGFSEVNSMNGGNTVETVNASKPYVALQVQNLTPDRRLTVWATDARGRRFDTLYSNLDYYALPIPPDVRKVDLHFVVETARKASFLIKPPTPPAKTAK